MRCVIYILSEFHDIAHCRLCFTTTFDALNVVLKKGLFLEAADGQSVDVYVERLILPYFRSSSMASAYAVGPAKFYLHSVTGTNRSQCAARWWQTSWNAAAEMKLRKIVTRWESSVSRRAERIIQRRGTGHETHLTYSYLLR